MQFKSIFVFLFVFSSLFVVMAKSYASQPLVRDSLQVRADSLVIRFKQDSVEALFMTKYAGIIYENPNRESYIQYQLRTLKATIGDPVYISDDLELLGQQEMSYGIAKETRPIWVLVTACVLLFFVGLIRLGFPTEFKIIIEAYYKERLLQQVSKEDSIATSWPYIFLYAIFSFTLGLFIVVVASKFNDPDVLNVKNYLRASGIIAALFIIKILMIRFISFVFELGKIVREYIAVVYLVYFNSMLVLLPFLLSVIFLPAKYFTILLTLFAVIASFLFIYRVLRTAVHLFGQTKFSISYLIIYLCTLEIAPILLLIRALGN